MWYISARNAPAQHPGVSAGELTLIRTGRDTLPDAADAAELAVNKKNAIPWKRLFTSREMVALTVSYFALGYVAWIFFGWFYIYLAQARGLNLKSSAVYSMLPFLGMTVGCLGGGVASDWITQRISPRVGRSVFAASCFALTAVLLVIGSNARGAATASIILGCGAGILYIPQGAFWAVAADFAGDFAGLSSGIMNMGAQIGGACTASLTPLIAAHFGWRVSFFTAASLALLGAFSWLMVDPRRRLAAESLPMIS